MNTRWVKNLIYNLKKKYGTAALLQHITNESQNPATGIRTTTKQRFKIKRVILLPVKMARLLAVELGFKGRAPGFDMADGIVIIENSDVSVRLGLSDYFIINEKRHDISMIEELENGVVSMIITKIINTHLEEIDLESKQALFFTHDAIGEL